MIPISIITVTFNSEKTLNKAMDSVLNQSCKPLEYIIVDGESTDRTLDIVNEYKPLFTKKGIELKVISEKDDGIYDAMNKGISLARGEVIGMINSDDWYEEDALKVVTDAYEKEGFDLFYADLRMHMTDGKTFVKKARNRKYATSRDWNHPTTFITAEIYKKYKYRNDTIHDDYDLILRLKKAGVKTVVVNKVIADFTMNGTSHERNLGKTLERIGIKYRIYRNNGYSVLYFFECFLVEIGKLLIG